jgi:two-component system sensor histidine kinase KdpD
VSAVRAGERLLAYLLVAAQPFCAAYAAVADLDRTLVAALLAAGLVAAGAVAYLDTARRRARDAAAEARLLADMAGAGGAATEVAVIAEAAARDLPARAVVVGLATGVLHDGGLGTAAAGVLARPDPAAATATGTLADGAAVTVCALPAKGATFGQRQRTLLAAVAGRVAVAVDRGRLNAESRRVELLEATEDQRSALVAAVSHDLRTPLAAIKASAAALADDAVAPGEREDLRDAICGEVDRLDRMVRNLLDLGRIESGRLVARREPVPADELVGSVLTRMRPALRGRRLELDVPDGLPPAYVDPVQAEQSLGNLVENVVAHTPVNAGLIVRAAARDGALVVRVADEGPGIPPHQAERLFERFTKGAASTRGSGLGLTIARAFAEANGGTLDLVPSDCGAAFELAFPLAEER